jgi:hypothetical protein
MFVQISPSSSDSGETLNSLKYASRVRSVEHGPACRQADPVESLKLKQMVSLFLASCIIIKSWHYIYTCYIN